MNLDDFAEQRGISVEFLEKLGLYVVEMEGDEGPPDFPLEGWIAIPFRHLSGQWYSRYRNPGDGKPKYFQPHGTPPHLYNPWSLGPQSAEVWFTEGEIDAMTLLYLGLPAVGIPGASTGQRFNKGWALLFESAAIAIACDGDEAGQKLAGGLQGVFPHAKNFLPPEGYDLNDWWNDDPDDMWDSLDSFCQSYGFTRPREDV